MSSRSATSGGGLDEKTRLESQSCEASSPQTPPSQPNAWSDHSAPVRSSSGIEPLPLPSRVKLGSAGDKPREFFRRLRRQPVHPVHPACQGPSINSEERPRPRGEPAQCDFQEVLDKVLPRTDGVAKYPEFDAAGLYVQSEEVLKVLWHAETERLINIARNPDIPLEFSSRKFFQGDTEKGYRDISNLCQKVLIALSICLLENEQINLEHCARFSNHERPLSFIKQFSKGQTILESVVGMGKANFLQETCSSLGATYELLNYISAVLTRLIVQTSPGSYWQTNVLSVLIKRITKIKLLLIDLPANSVIGAGAAGAFLSKIRDSISTQQKSGEMDEDEECEDFMQMVETQLEEVLVSSEEKQAAAHCVEQSKFQFGLNSALRHILISMGSTNRAGLPSSSFEICAVAYETGFEGFKALLFQDRDLQYSATSDLDNMNTAHSAFNILNQIVIHLKHQNREQEECTNGLKTTLQWKYCGDEDNRSGQIDIDLAGSSQRLRLSSMDEVITVMVPLAMTCPIFLADFTSFRHVIALTGFIQDDVQPLAEGKFGAFFRMYTSQFDSMRRPGVLHLSEALDCGFFSRSRLVRSSHPPPKEQHEATHQLNELKRLTKYMDEWVVDETCVTVSCPGYVWGVIFTAVLFAAGGLGVGFSVGQRINGVDPSNLATYLWVVAAFIVLVGKSMKVKEWTWNDFLRGRVRCCSVSELQSVTRIDGQLIIAKLLHDERRGSVLEIRGPYNSAFLRRSPDGFSIDKPISSSTLLISGLTMLKVVTAKGHALVCLDFRRGTDLRVIGHIPDPEKEHLICEQIDRLQPGVGATADGAQHQTKHAFSRSKDLKWKRVQGIYEKMDAKFV
ncbi:hypothetical protein BDP55DRAFT_541964 [Colletotrichum godetiae]|uniref:Uncharacterized protein n=1 Tax=Colletotrichum godetiae TaxID=1209918 RepID=A0AAJ0AX46_9PEZI|nr:uncharacterized protein BDP55DRAFT_541964 [Colletotrichum godetiae]KAK1691448.1 hypothetical protein BDP55DRAFT_541964 [Colletotrichum godetiae]